MSESGEEIVTQRNNMKLVGFLVFVLLFVLIPLLTYRYAITNTGKINKSVPFDIKQGASVATIANELEYAGLIDSPFFFKLYLKLNGLEKNIQAGSYIIPAKSSIVDLANLLQDGRNDIAIQYLEGWRIEQLGQVLSEELGLDYTDFVTQAQQYEGYLFPDTYFFKKDAGVEEVIQKLSNTFEEKTSDLLDSRTLSKAGLTRDEAVIFASLVEREVRHSEDRAKVAGILIKRYQEGLKLDVDATTQYAIALPRQCGMPQGCFVENTCDLPAAVDTCMTQVDLKNVEDIKWWPVDLTISELAYENPYNTRKLVGLPPGPISSFGISALEAVINYEETPYYFYLNDSEGTTHFAATYEEHNANINRYLR